MRAYKATFTKKNGDVRTMTFAKVTDVPASVLPESKGGRETSFKEGLELVWDLERGGYRVFNWQAVVGKVEEFETQIKGEKNGY